MTATPRYFTGRSPRGAGGRLGGRLDGRRGHVRARSSPAHLRARPSSATCSPTTRWSSSAWTTRCTATGPSAGEFVTPDGEKVTDARTLAGQIGLAKAMRKYDLHRIITFHSRVKRRQRLRAECCPRSSTGCPPTQRPQGRLEPGTSRGRCPQRAASRPAAAAHRPAGGSDPADQRPMPRRGRRRADPRRRRVHRPAPLGDRHRAGRRPGDPQGARTRRSAPSSCPSSSPTPRTPTPR